MNFLDHPVRIPFTRQTTTVKYALVHTGYWLLITGFFLYEKRYLLYKAGLPYFAACVTIRVVLLIVLAYLNVHYFLPRYLLTGKYWRYFGLILFSVLIYLLVQAFYDFLLYGFVVAPTLNRDWVETLSYNFFSTLWYLGLMVPLKLSIDWYEQQRLIQKIAVEKLEAEVNFLRSQVNPHFLFNILNSLYALTLKKSDLAPEMVLKLSEMMEYMLYDSVDESVPVEKEISYLKNYIELEKLRYGSQSDISMTILGRSNGQGIAPLLLLPLVENAFKHGIGRLPEHAWLRSTLKLQPAEIQITVENNKPEGIAADQKGGIGLNNLRKRLELLYPGRYTLQTENLPDRYRASLSIQFSH